MRIPSCWSRSGQDDHQFVSASHRIGNLCTEKSSTITIITITGHRISNQPRRILLQANLTAITTSPSHYLTISPQLNEPSPCLYFFFFSTFQLKVSVSTSSANLSLNSRSGCSDLHNYRASHSAGEANGVLHGRAPAIQPVIFAWITTNNSDWSHELHS